MNVPESTAPESLSLADAVDEFCRQQGLGVEALARRARMMPRVLQSLLDGEAASADAVALEALARVLGLAPVELQEYRLALVVGSFSHDVPGLHNVFLDSLSPIERELIGGAEFSMQPFGATVWRLLARHELTQQELAESIGVTQPALSRVMTGRERPSVDLLEVVAQALDSGPEMFVEYRAHLVEEWLHERPERADELFEALTHEPALAAYHHWPTQPLPDPRRVAPRALLESLIEIVRLEGPVMGARVYDLRLAASGLTETRELRSLLNRAIAAASRFGLLIDEDERGDGTQKFRVLRLPGQPEIYPRVLGQRRLWQVPPRELDAVLRATAAWKQGGSILDIQLAVLAAFGVSSASPADAEQLNHSIMRSRQGGQT